MIHGEKINSNAAKVLFFFCFGVLGFFAIFFNVERLYGDSAAYLFSIVNSEWFYIAHYRPPSFFIQILPVLLIKLNVDLKYVILSFSLNEWLYFFLSSLILRIVSGNWNLSFAILFSLLIGVRYNYFNPVSELIIASPFLFLLYFVLESKIKIFIKLFCTVLISVFLVFSHPIYCLIIPFLLLVNYYKKFKENKLEALFVLFTFLIILVVRYFLSGNYDSDPLKEVGNPGQRGFSFLLKFNYARMLSTLIPVYLGVVFIFFITIYRLIKRKEKFYAGFLLLFIIGYFSLVMYKFARFFPDTYEPFERYLFPIPLVICLVYFTHCYNKTFLEHLLLFLVAIYYFGLLFTYGKFVKERYNFLNNAIVNCDQFKGCKFAFRNENYFPIPKGHDWIMSSESMLLSGARGSDKVKQIIVKEYYPSDTLNLLQMDQIIYFPFPMWRKEITQINTDYFNLQPSPLLNINTDTIQSNQPDSFFTNISINIGGHSDIKKNQELLIPITIHNDNCIPLYSGLRKEEVYVSYHWIKNGKVAEWDGLRTPIMCDVKNTIFQFMKLKSPVETGDYQLKADIIFEGKKWAGVTSENNRIYKVQ